MPLAEGLYLRFTASYCVPAISFLFRSLVFFSLKTVAVHHVSDNLEYVIFPSKEK